MELFFLRHAISDLFSGSFEISLFHLLFLSRFAVKTGDRYPLSGLFPRSRQSYREQKQYLTG